MLSLQGQFLIASPHLDDPNFMRAVVLMIQHDDDGAFGLILNRPFEQQLADVLTPEFGNEWNCEMPVYVGGPVPGPLIAIHNNEEFAEQAVIPGRVLVRSSRSNGCTNPRAFLRIKGISRLFRLGRRAVRRRVRGRWLARLACRSGRCL